IDLTGDINVISAQDSEGMFKAATGVSVSGDSNAIDITGNVNLSADHASDSRIASDTALTGITVSGNSNDITHNGTTNINDNDLSTVDEQSLDVIGLNVTGDNNSIEIDGGINITHNRAEDGYSAIVTGINVSGNSEVTLSGRSVVDTVTIAGGNVILAQ